MEHLLDKYGPWALVTGASSGIGEQFCHILAERGFNLLISARREALLHALKKTLEEKHGIQVVSIATDLSIEQEQQNLWDVVKNYDVGLMISNAGFGYKGLFELQPEQELEAMLQVNLLAPTRLLYQLLPTLKKRHHSGVILTGSIEGETPFPYSAAYAASKAYLHSLANALYHEGKRGNGSDERQSTVDVLVLSPGSTDTQAPVSQGISRDQLLGIMQPDDVAFQALRALGRQSLIIPGWHNRLFIRCLRWLPRRLAILSAGLGMKKAIDNSH